MGLQTDRLRLHPVDLELLDAAGADDRAAIEKLGYKTNGEWPGADYREALPYFRQELIKNRGTKGFDGWIFIDKFSREILGGIGFVGNPDAAGRIEIGFATNPSQQRKGYCFEAAEALLGWAAKQPLVNHVIASCEQDNAASAKLLEKLGFVPTVSYDELLHWRYAANGLK